MCSCSSASASENSGSSQAEQPEGCGLRHIGHQTVGGRESIDRGIVGGGYYDVSAAGRFAVVAERCIEVACRTKTNIWSDV